jgi:hypothetical protein
MNVEAWVFWQADWGVIDFGNATPQKQFYALAQATNFIRPGFQVIAVDADNTLAAYSFATQRLVLVATNWDTATPVDYDLNAFVGDAPAVSVYRTTADAATNLAPQTGIAIDSTGQLRDTLPVRSITTYVIDGVSPQFSVSGLLATGFVGALHPRNDPTLCMTVSNDTQGPATAAIEVAACQPWLDAQTFTYDPVTGHLTVYAGAQQMCLNVWGGVAANGAHVGTWACEDVANERFSFDPARSQLRMWAPASGTSGSCFDLSQQPLVAGADVLMLDCANPPTAYQQFDISFD